MEYLKSAKKEIYIPGGINVLRPGTLIAAVFAVVVAQMVLAVPAVLNGLFQQDLGTGSAQLTWISDAFLVPVCVLELSFGVLRDLFSRKRDPFAGWRWAFLVVLALALISAVVSPAAARDSSSPLLFAVVQGPTSGGRNWQILAGFTVAGVFLMLFVIGMFAFLGTAYSTSIRLSAIQGFSPLKTSIAFLFLRASAVRVDRDRGKHAANALAGMASGTTNMLRDFGFTLGPAVIGAVALSQAAAAMRQSPAASAVLAVRARSDETLLYLETLDE
jgi:hypothetical protein